MWLPYEYFRTVDIEFTGISSTVTRITRIYYHYLKGNMSFEDLIKCKFPNWDKYSVDNYGYTLRKRLFRGNLSDEEKYYEYCDLLNIDRHISDEEIIILYLLNRKQLFRDLICNEKKDVNLKLKKKELFDIICDIEEKVRCTLPDIKYKCDEQETSRDEIFRELCRMELSKLPYQFIYIFNNWKQLFLSPNIVHLQFLLKFNELNDTGKKAIIEYMERIFSERYNVCDMPLDFNDNLDFFDEISTFDFAILNENDKDLWIDEIFEFLNVEFEDLQKIWDILIWLEEFCSGMKEYSTLSVYCFKLHYFLYKFGIDMKCSISGIGKKDIGNFFDLAECILYEIMDIDCLRV